MLSVPPGFTETRVATGADQFVAMAVSPDGRLFVSEKNGAVRVIKDDLLLPTPFVRLPVATDGERGVYGIAFDPDFTSNHYVYVYYTARSPVVHNRVSRFTARGDVAASGSEQVLLDLDRLANAYHNGGALHFGVDGKLYVSTGDDVPANAQSLSSDLGKILRINSDGSIPADNPFHDRTTGKYRAIWARGLRNPFTFAVQPTTGRFFINDVGGDGWEEVNEGKAGANYGWPATEGPFDAGRFPGYTNPVHAYRNPSNAAVTGGTFYNPPTAQFPASYRGDYFFGELWANEIRRLDPDTGNVSVFATNTARPVDLDVAADGSLYYLSNAPNNVGGRGQVFRIRYTGSAAPVIGTQPASQTVSVGQPVTFSVSASGATPLSYQWQRNGVSIPGATSSSYTVASPTTSLSGSSYRVAVSNSAGRATSNSAVLTVTSNRLPMGTIASPATGAVYRGGQAVSFSGSATDPETGGLPASAFTWEVVFHHNDHTHPFMAPRTGIRSGTFTIPRTGETAADVFYRIHLRVKDAAGLTHEVTRDVKPLVVDLKLATSVPGLSLTLDGSPVRAPFSTRAVAGLGRTIGAPPNQALGGVTYDFVSWSDGGAPTHGITTPDTSTTYTAVYRARGTTGSGNGLRATYFDSVNLTTPKVTRTDAAVNFNWGTGSPHSSMGADTFSARWTGFVQPAKSETHTFYVRTNDGARLWVNDQLLINKWGGLGLGEYSGSITLTGGRKYSIRLEYMEETLNAQVTLSWSSAGVSKQVIPSGRLFVS
jgi:glucose/arabinose dehydrogenase